tara:strand:- start:2110 stop:2295 length:186 start_codon:yes stop_codon:yes gene_type:complete
MLTRKDFIAMGEIIAQVDCDFDRTFLVDKFSNLFSNDNPRFNKEKFRGFVEDCRHAELSRT